jgi:hypothetical protein
MPAIILLVAVILFLVVVRISEGEGSAALIAHIFVHLVLWLLVVAAVTLICGVVYFALSTPSYPVRI